MIGFAHVYLPFSFAIPIPVTLGVSDYLKAFIIILVIYSAFNFILGLAAIDDPEEKDARKFLSKLYYKFIN